MDIIFVYIFQISDLVGGSPLVANKRTVSYKQEENDDFKISHNCSKLIRTCQHKNRNGNKLYASLGVVHCSMKIWILDSSIILPGPHDL